MPIFFPAYLAENEAMNLYGLRVTGLNIDYGAGFLPQKPHGIPWPAGRGQGKNKCASAQ